VYLAEAAGIPLGCAALREAPGADAAELKRFYVAPEARGRGLGQALLDTAIAEARSRGFTRLILDTLEDRMAGAIALYRRAGFVDTGRRTTSAGLHLLDMALDL
jgi:ribosomal protein S18 acetylase RimI-like enzyme